MESINEILPQRYPFLFIDKIVELEPGKKAVAYKNVSINEEYFNGHFPGKPVMPGALIIEAMSQASILLYHSAYKNSLENKPEYYLGSIKARFLNPVFPGDQLKLTAETVKLIPTGAFVEAKAYVGEKIIAEAELIFSVKQ